MVNNSEKTIKTGFSFVEEIILILMLCLSLMGVWITDYSPMDGYGYWMIMVFVFALFAIAMSWLKTKTAEISFRAILREQGLHWFVSLLMVEGIYTLYSTGHLNSSDAGLVIMMILSQSTILDGVRIGWRFSLVGIFLGITAIIAVYTQHFFWIGSILALCIAIGGLTGQLWLNKKHS